MLRTAGLQTHIWNNNLKSIVLLAFYPLLILGLAWCIAGLIGGFFAATTTYVSHGGIPSDPAQVSPASVTAVFKPSAAFANQMIGAYWPLILTGVTIWFIAAFFFHTKMVRSLCKSHPVTRKEEPELYNLLENLCIAQGVTMPKFEIIESHARNAFASGITEKTFTITLTRGLLNSLEKDEIEAVIAHELAHILNRDVRLLIVSIIFTGMIGFAAQLVWANIRYNLRWGMGRAAIGGRRRRESGGGDGRALTIMFAILIVLWLGYLATLFTRFALSRRREYMADAGAVDMTKNPEAMMRALMRISGKDRIPTATDDIALMCIENSSRFMGMFATHPPIDKRIQAISSVTSTPVPSIRTGSRADDGERFQKGDQNKNPWVTRERKIRKNPWIRS